MDFSTIMQPLRATLLSWINLSTKIVKHQALLDLTNCQFFCLMLPKVKGFKWAEGGDWNTFKDLAVGEKVKRLRAVGRSISKFYQEQLDLSIDNLAFNYIEICTSSEDADILRLLIAVIGVLVRSEEIVSELQTFMVSLGEDELGLFKIMVDYASTIGEKSSREEQYPSKRQKKLIGRLESVEEDLQFYEQYTQQLEAKLQIETDEANRHKLKKQELEKEGNKLVKKIQHLENLTDQLNKELTQKAKQEELLLQRLNNNRVSAQDIVDKLVEDNQQYRQEIKSLRKKISSKIDKDQQLKKLERENKQNQILIDSISFKMEQQKKEIETLKKQNNQLRYQIQLQASESEQQKIKLDLYEKTFRNNRTSCLSADQESIVLPTALGDSYVECTPSQQWYKISEQENMRRSDLAQSLNFSRHTNPPLKYPCQIGFLELKDLESPEKKTADKENINPNLPKNKYLQIQELQEQNSLDIPESNLNIEGQLGLLVATILDLQGALQETRKQLWSYKGKQARRAERSVKFAAKVNGMFA